MDFHRCNHFAHIRTVRKLPSLHRMQNLDVGNIHTQEFSRNSRAIAERVRICRFYAEFSCSKQAEHSALSLRFRS